VAEEELIKARNKAEENDKLKTAFLHNISHEIRTPMNAISGFASLLAEPGLTEERKSSYIEVILGSSDHLLSVVSDIIEISNIEAGILKYNQEVVNLNLQMNSLRRQFSIKTVEKGLELICDLPFSDEEASIETDKTKLQVILENLLNNAVKFTRSGRIEFGYYLAGSNLLFRVSDTGIGIPVEHQLRVFDRFYQVEQTISRSYEGTGLGLSISQAYAEFLGGKIWIESEPGKGSVFCFTIPYRPINSTLIPDYHQVPLKNKESDISATVLVAEDEDNCYKLLELLLLDSKLNIVRARNGKEAYDICTGAGKIDLVLMDMKMPEMDGLEATREIKKARPGIPIIGQSAYAFETDIKRAMDAGCDEYITKPFELNNLMSLIRNYCKE
jgi:CheY-like chemotaxis protein